MVDTSDVQGYHRKFDNQMDRLENADIDEDDRDAIRRFIAHCRANDSTIGSLGTVVGHLNRLRLASERGHVPLTALDDVDDVNALKLHLGDVQGLGQGTIRNYMKALRKFLIWHHRGEDWPDDVQIGAPPERKHDPDEEISSEDLNALLQAANEFDTAAREKALIAVLQDTGLRIGAVLSFQLRHVDLETRRGTLTINEEANVKDADGPKPLTWSREYVSNWLDVHPRPDVDHAALFHKTRSWGDDEDGALAQQYAGRRIKDVAEKAGLDRDRIHAHLFRATAVSDWIRDDIHEQTIKNRIDWSPDSREFSTYSRVSDEEFNDMVFDHYGIEGEAGAVETTGPTLTDCYICDAKLQSGAEYCPSCGAPVDRRAAEELDDFESEGQELLVDEDDRAVREVLVRGLRRAGVDDESAGMVADQLLSGE